MVIKFKGVFIMKYVNRIRIKRLAPAIVGIMSSILLAFIANREIKMALMLALASSLVYYIQWGFSSCINPEINFETTQKWHVVQAAIIFGCFLFAGLMYLGIYFAV